MLLKKLKEKLYESIQAVLPICIIVTFLSMTFTPLGTDIFALFFFGSILLILGMSLFTLGAEMSMTVMGEEIGKKVAESKNIALTISICFILGTVITIAEPDLAVLAEQIPSIPNSILIVSVSIGVGVFLVIGQMRNIFHLKLNCLLIIFYGIIFCIVVFSNPDFIPVAFDSAGVTTGPITVPFIMAFGIGLARLRIDENASNDSFGLIALCSIGPILAVLLLSIFYNPTNAISDNTTLFTATTMKEILNAFLIELPSYFEEVAFALLPIIILFVTFQMKTKKFPKHTLIKIAMGLIYTYLGLVLFLCSANVGFMNAGTLIGEYLANNNSILLILIGALIGYFIVKAEPAIIVLTDQVEDISNGAISAKTIEHALSISIAFSIALSMIRVITGISILWYLIPGYITAIILSFITPPIYTGIAFDSGGVASGPMTTTFLLPFAMGACKILGGNMMTDAFGIVAMVALTPLITIQIVGVIDLFKTKKATATALNYFCNENNEILFFDEEFDYE